MYQTFAPGKPWEEIASGEDRHVSRLAVPGGWIYVVIENSEGGGILNELAIFVPKPARAGREA